MLGLGVLLCAAGGLGGQNTAEEIVDRVDRMMRGESSRGRVEMEIVTQHWTRSMVMEISSLGTEHALIRIASPRKDAGTTTLKSGNEIWNYLPRVDRTIKLPSSLMGSAWMGSHFTNDDLVKEHRLIEDYDIEISFEGSRDGVDVWEFRLKPRPEAAVIWDRISYQVRKSDLMPVWARFYDERDDLIRTIEWSEYDRSSGRLVPMLMTIEPADKPGESTTVRYTDLAFDVPLTEADFSLRTLRSPP
ncbi:MAG: outer membrane lipoprotein-sorting protein [Gemmatimonadota bacterium]|nr:outer membrane lipoprotein-sorting protein [Gemmatimonadota bacterium]